MNNSVWTKPGTLANIFWERAWDLEDPATAPIPIYDMHGHMGTHNAIYFARCEADEMVKHLKRIGIRRLVFSHHHALWGALRNSEVQKITAKYPEILRFYVSINPHKQNDIKEDLANYDKMAPLAVGIKLLPDYHHIKVTDKAYEQTLEFANERKLPVLVHTWGGSPYDGAAVMEEAALRYPQIIFFMGHSFSGDWKGAKKVADNCPNTFFELTSLPGQTGVIERLVKDIGSKRIIFGTDMPWFDEFQHVGGVLSADISEDDKHNILYRNVENLLGKDW